MCEMLFRSLKFSLLRNSLSHIHKPDDGRKFAVRPLLSSVEDILHPATPAVPGFGLGTQMHLEVSKDEAFQSKNSMDVIDGLSSIIDEISSKISSKFSDGIKKHVTGEVFEIVKHYDWDAKVVLALAAFAFNYGEFWVLAQPDFTNSLARSVPLVKQLPETPPPEGVDILKVKPELLKQLPQPPKHVYTLETKFVELRDLMKAILDLTKCIIQLEEIKHETGQFKYAVYWTIRGILACAAQIMSLVGMRYKNISSTKASKLPFLARKVRDQHYFLREELTNLQKSTEETAHNEEYNKLKELMKTQQEKVMRALIYAKDDMLPLFKGSANTRASMEALMGKHVLLLISNLFISNIEISMLNQKYQELRLSKRIESDQFELVWLPVVDESKPWTQEKQDQFENLQLIMPWYSVYHPSMISQAVIVYIKKVWQFDNNPILVVLDPEGKLVNNNAFHMLWIWGSHAFPFTRAREEELWKKVETWTIEFLVDGVDPAPLTWIAKNKCVCFYGGGEIDWIRKFTRSAKSAAQVADIQLEMLYVGKSNLQEKDNLNILSIVEEKLSHSMNNFASFCFWARLGSMGNSRKLLDRSAENDPIMQEIESLLSFDKNNQAWAMFCTGRGSAMAKADGESILQYLQEFSLLKTQVNDKDLVTALNEYQRKISVARIMESPHEDNMNVLRALIYAKEDQLPLLQGATKTKASLEVLMRKHVLLLISDLDVSCEELHMLKQKYQVLPVRCCSCLSFQCELVWLPVADEPWNQAKQDQLTKLQSIMQWYSIYHPSMIDAGVIIYIKEVWQFKKKPIIVVLNPKGKVVNNNAFHMIWIWGSYAFPFTKAREEELWKKEENWTIELLVDDVDAAIRNWIEEDKYICLYGGEGIEWIKKFTATANKVKKAAGIPMEILYVGTRNSQEKVRKNICTITEEKLSHTLQDLAVWFFWVRLESMWHSKKQLGGSLHKDVIMQEVDTILGFDKIGDGWAILCKGSDMAKAKAEIILQCLLDFNSWKSKVEETDFMNAIKNQLSEVQKPH